MGPACWSRSGLVHSLSFKQVVSCQPCLELSYALPCIILSCNQVGLALIPFIIHPIDNGVDYLFDNTLRKAWSPSRPATARTQLPTAETGGTRADSKKDV